MRDIGPDTVIDGRYQVIRHLGQGGMADVYVATDLQLGRQVALKLLHDRFAQDEEFVERFRREASSAAGLQHQHVVSVYDRGEWNGTAYIAMEYVPGRTLKEIVNEEAPLESGRAIDLALQMLSAARFAHRRGVIHRDLKPHNVIVDEEGRAKVTDFGIAKAGASDMTMTGSIMGTAQYLSPEQAQGHQVSAVSDLYSIGIVLYEMLTAKVPFDAESAVTIALKQVNETPVPPSQINPSVTPELEAVVLKAMAKDPAARFTDADEFSAALEAADAGQPTTAFAPVDLTDAGYPEPDPQHTGVYVQPEAFEERGEDEREPRKRKWWPWVLAGVLLLVLAAGALALALSDEDQSRVPNVVGSTISVAQQRLENDGFEVEVVRDNSDKPRNSVFGQDPAGGSVADEGTTVTLRVSDGPAIVAVPDVTGKGRRAAAKQLKEAGFKVDETTEFSDDVGVNRVIEQTPSARSQAEQGTVVSLRVSKGKERKLVPDVVRKDEDDARATLEEAGFRVVRREEENSAEPGTVLAQDPAQGTRVAAGSTVTITVAIEPKQVAVPDVVGRSQDRATELLSQQGFEVNVEQEEVDSIQDDGIVQSQSPSGGDRKADRGSQVTITVGQFNPDLDPENETTTPQTTPQTTPTPPATTTP